MIVDSYGCGMGGPAVAHIPLLDRSAMAVNENQLADISPANRLHPMVMVAAADQSRDLAARLDPAAPVAEPRSLQYQYGQVAGDILTYSNLVRGSIFSIPKSWSKESTDEVLVTVYSFIKTFVRSSGAGQGSIDNRIEQAMDLVKSHLMSAVRTEVEELRDKISKLEDTVNLLSRENEILRSNCNPEILAGLSGMRVSLQGPVNAPPPDQPH